MGLFNGLKKDYTTVGLDIGSHSVKLAKLRHTKDSYILEAIGMKELPAGIVENGEIKNKEGLIDVVTAAVNQCDPSIVDVVISMSGHGILSDVFTFKVDANDNIEETILWEAGQRSPFDVEDITLDYKILRKRPDKEELDVLIIGAKNHIMQSYIDLLYDAGLRPIIVDVDAFAITNSFAVESEVTGLPENEIVALVNIGHTITNVVFLKDGIYHSSRDITTASDFLVKSIKRNLNVDESEALDIVKGKKDTSEYDAAEMERAFEYAFEEIASGIDLAFSYFRNMEKTDTIHRMVLSGGGSYIKGIPEFLADRFNTNVQMANPFSYLEYDPLLFGNTNPLSVAGFMNVAIGLALRNSEL